MMGRSQKYVFFFVICLVAVLDAIVGVTIGQSIAGHTPEPFSIVLRVALFAFGLSALAWLWRIRVDAA